MILDEPTSALDNENEQRVKEILSGIKGKCTIIMIAHRLTTVQDFDSIAVLESGRIVEQGSYEELMAMDGVFRKMKLEQDGE